MLRLARALSFSILELRDHLEIAEEDTQDGETGVRIGWDLRRAGLVRWAIDEANPPRLYCHPSVRSSNTLNGSLRSNEGSFLR